MPLDRTFDRRLAALVNAKAAKALQGGLKGLEKESLRVTPKGQIAKTPHPKALGSALTNEHITTDYSEALIELVTPAVPNTWELVQYLCDLHQFVYRHMEDELLWATSMPCAIKGDESIPIAQYGRSNVGRMKTVYREGLGHRYGRVMQAISGVHFNYSFPEHFWPVLADLVKIHDSGQDFRSDAYFGLLRNYRRHGWLVLYLFGTSPAICPSFLQGRKVDWLEEFVPGSLYAPYATSLRMSDLGYRNTSQASLSVSVNSLDHYIRDLTRAITTPHPDYEKIGVKVDGEYRQLNANVLQIENEYYSFIRPKRVTQTGERPTKALQRGGVQYVEMRSLDVSPFDPVGVNQNKLRFLEAFAAYCVLSASPSIETSEQQELDGNHVRVAREGRRPGLSLRRDGRDVSLRDWANEIVDSMRGVCEMLDEGDPQRPFATALEVQAAKVRDVALTPSARILEEMRTNEESFFNLALRMSGVHKSYFLELYSPNEARQEEFAAEAEASLAGQARIEANDRISFDEYLARYFAA
ncbi:MAG: glutamate--cysteine ligase [Steroidobacteraceae bacterium]